MSTERDNVRTVKIVLNCARFERYRENMGQSAWLRTARLGRLFASDPHPVAVIQSERLRLLDDEHMAAEILSPADGSDFRI